LAKIFGLRPDLDSRIKAIETSKFQNAKLSRQIKFLPKSKSEIPLLLNFKI
jgi:hypothetical protein